MARDTASKVILILCLYFFLLFIVTFMMNTMSSTYDLTDSGDYTAEEIELRSSTGFADSPRVNSEGKTYTLYRDGKLSTLQTWGLITNQNECEYFQGSVWENDTNFWGFLPFVDSTSSDMVCTGGINLTYYDSDEVFEYEYTTNTSYFLEWGGDICDLSDIDTPDEAYRFGCTWYPPQTDLNTDGSLTTIFTTLGDIFSMSITFSTTNTMLNVLLNFIFVLIPFLACLLAIYVMIR